MRKNIIAGNWKMYKTTQEAVQLAENLKKSLALVQDVEVILCPTYTRKKSAPSGNLTLVVVSTTTQHYIFYILYNSLLEA